MHFFSQISVPRRIWGYILLMVGLAGDCGLGMLLLVQTRASLLPLHLLFLLLWLAGSRLSKLPENTPAVTLRFWKRTRLSRWEATTLLLSLFTFPGAGLLVCSVAMLIGLAIPAGKPQSVLIAIPAVEEETIAKPLEADIEPLSDLLEDDDLALRRSAITHIGLEATPGAVLQLRQLLTDPQADIRTDASITLTRLEDSWSQQLTRMLQEWRKHPEDQTISEQLADLYYRYATSNLLDRQTSRIYLLNAQKLVERHLAQTPAQAHQWLLMARIHGQLGAQEQAFKDVLHALSLQPELPGAFSCALELSFQVRDWETLSMLITRNANQAPTHAEEAEALQSWQTALSPIVSNGDHYAK